MGINSKNSDNKEDADVFLFKPSQFLGEPKAFPPRVHGKLPVVVQFIIPQLKIGNKDKPTILEYAHLSITDFWQLNIETVKNKTTNEQAIYITLAFYISRYPSEDDSSSSKVISTSLFYVEKFLSLLSFFMGTKLSAEHIQYNIKNEDGSFKKILPVIRRTAVPKIKDELRNYKIVEPPNEEVFNALLWLRRGLAEHDPIITFSSLMVSLEIMARLKSSIGATLLYCEKCGQICGHYEYHVTASMKDFLVDILGCTIEKFNELWAARNSIVAHGRKTLSPEEYVKLTELKFEAANFAYKGMKLCLGIDINSPLSPSPMFYVTDALMHIY